MPGCSCGLHRDADVEALGDLTGDESSGESSNADVHDAAVGDVSTAPLSTSPGSEGFQDWLDHLDRMAMGKERGGGPAHGAIEAYPIGLMPLGVGPLSISNRLLVTASCGIDMPPGYAPALSDNGASNEASCSRSLDGAILTSRNPDSKALGGASKHSMLAVAGSYVYVHDWLDATGRVTRRVRRFRHASDLVVPIVISEGSEVYEHKTTFTFAADTGRYMTESNGQVSPLFMNSVKLGWFMLKPVTDEADVTAALARANNGVYDLVVKAPYIGITLQLRGDEQPCTAWGITLQLRGDGQPCSSVTKLSTDGRATADVRMHNTADIDQTACTPYVHEHNGVAERAIHSIMANAQSHMTGVPLLRHMHSRMGHQSVRAIVHALQAEGHRKDCVTRSDIEQFVNEKHGACAAHEGMQRAHAPRAIANRSVPQQRFLTKVERCLGVCPACVDYDGANPAPGALGFGCDECLDGYKEPACDNDPPTCAAWYCSRGGPPCYGGSPTPCVCNDGDAAGLAPAPTDNGTHFNASSAAWQASLAQAQTLEHWLLVGNNQLHGRIPSPGPVHEWVTSSKVVWADWQLNIARTLTGCIYRLGNKQEPAQPSCGSCGHPLQVVEHSLTLCPVCADHGGSLSVELIGVPEEVELEVDIDEDAPALLDWFAGIDDLIRMPDTWLGTDVIGEVANPGGWFRPPKFFSPGHVCSNGKRGAKLCMCMHEPPRCGAWQCSRSSLASGACTDGAGCACGV